LPAFTIHSGAALEPGSLEYSQSFQAYMQSQGMQSQGMPSGYNPMFPGGLLMENQYFPQIEGPEIVIEGGLSLSR